MAKNLLTLEGLCKYYTGTQSVVMGLNNVSLSFDRGEFVAITGESGSGKSTLAHVIGGILPYESGEMYFGGKPTSHFDGADYERYRRDHISFISQNYGILPGSSVLENVVSALRLTGLEKREAKQKAKDILTEVELWPMRRRRAAKLSSGQKQRLSIARALAKPAPILIADEPTGNLDPENSAKVIRLLAHAAKERLVILITHEFSEAEDQVTRHIVIQDGSIAMDVRLRPAPPPETPAAPKKAPRAKLLSPYIARLQLSGRPVWSTLVLLFFSLTAFAVFAFLGTFIVHLDDTSTRIYDNSAFLNGSQERIVAVRSDGEAFTQADYDALVGVAYVESLERYGYVADVQYAWREGVDFDYDYNRETEGDPFLTGSVVVMEKYVRLRANAPYMQTVPVLHTGEEFLTAGRMPKNSREIVLCGSESRIGEKIIVHFRDNKTWSAGDVFSVELKVVGVTDHGFGIYVHDDLARSLTSYALAPSYTYLLLPSTTLYPGECRPSENLYQTSSHSGYVSFLKINMEDAVENRKSRSYNEWLYLLDESGNIKGRDMEKLMDALYVRLSGEDLLKEYNEDIILDLINYNLVDLMGASPLLDFGYPDEQLLESFLYYYEKAVWQQGGIKPEKYQDLLMMLMERHLQTTTLTQEGPGSFRLSGQFRQTMFMNFTGRDIIPYHDNHFTRMVEVSYEDFYNLTWSETSDQVSLTIEDYAYTEQLLEEIHDLGYLAISPFRESSTEQDPELAQERMQTLTICAGAMLAVVLLQIIVLRAMFSAQTESYRTLSSMGLTCGRAKRSILWQILLFTALGQLLGFGAILVCRERGIERIVYLMRYLPPVQFAILCAVHLAVSLVAALWIMNVLGRQVYPLARKRGDLKLEEEEV